MQTEPKLGVDYILLEDYFWFEPDILLVHRNKTLYEDTCY